MQRDKEEEIRFYKAKCKKYKHEITEIKDQIAISKDKNERAQAEKDRYKEKLLKAKEDIARFDQIVSNKVGQKSANLVDKIEKLKNSLTKRDFEIKNKSSDINAFITQLSENDEYIRKLERRLEELIKEKLDTKIIKSGDKTDMTDKSNDIEISVMKEPLNLESSESYDLPIESTPPKNTRKADKISKAFEYNPPSQPADYGVTVKRNQLHNSLPNSIKDASYFDVNEQRRTLLINFSDQKFAKMHQKENLDLDIND